MQAVILAGGQGTRLFPLTLQTPKPLLPIMGQSLLSYLVRHLTTQGIDEILITSGYLGGAIARAVQGMEERVPIHVVQESVTRGTAGAVIDLLPRLRSPFLVVSGDAILALDIAALLAAHQEAQAIATLAVMRPADHLRFGVVRVESGLVTHFVEKPGVLELVPELLLNTGTYMLEREALEGAATDGAVDFAHEIFPRLLRAGHRLAAAPALAFWRDIGTPESFREAHFEALSGEWPWPTPPAGSPPGVGPGVRITGRVGFGEGVVVGAGSRIQGPAYLGSGVHLGPGTDVTRSVLLAGSRTSGSCILRDAVVDVGVSVPHGTVVSGAILGRLAEQGRHPAPGRSHSPRHLRFPAPVADPGASMLRPRLTTPH